MKNILGFLFILSGFCTAQAKDVITYGEPVAVGNGQVRSFIKTAQNGIPLALGFWMSGKALDNLPTKDTVYQIELPTTPIVAPYNHLTLDWISHGHIPPGIYDVPHFDFHFYLVSSRDRTSISCADKDANVCLKKPDADKIPTNYVGAPVGEPHMGWHWFDSTSPEFNKQPFTATFIYGFYNGEVIFLEPMVTLSTLKSSANIDKNIPHPKKFALRGFYPTRYAIVHDSPTDSLWVHIKNFKWY